MPTFVKQLWRSLLVLGVLAITAGMTLAQEAEEVVEATEEAPQGIELGILLLGLMAVIAVAMVTFGREQSENEATAE